MFTNFIFIFLHIFYFFFPISSYIYLLTILIYYYYIFLLSFSFAAPYKCHLKSNRNVPLQYLHFQIEFHVQVLCKLLLPFRIRK